MQQILIKHTQTKSEYFCENLEFVPANEGLWNNHLFCVNGICSDTSEMQTDMINFTIVVIILSSIDSVEAMLLYTKVMANT